MKHPWRAAGAVVLILACGVPTSFAHALLTSSSPGAGAVLTAPPPSVVLAYTEPFDADQITVTVTRADGTQVASNKDKGFSVDWATATLPLPPLGPGTYAVTWDVNLRPGHETHGQFTFEVSP